MQGSLPALLRTLLPDIVADLHGRGFEVQLQGRIDAGRGGGLRTTFEVLPDAPVKKFTMRLFGGKHGLLSNGEDLCRARPRAHARFVAQSNETEALKPKIKVKCGKKGRRR